MKSAYERDKSSLTLRSYLSQLGSMHTNEKVVTNC